MKSQVQNWRIGANEKRMSSRQRTTKGNSIRLCVVLVVVTPALMLFCQSKSTADFDLDTTSPNGTYRVTVRGRKLQERNDGGQRVTAQLFKGDKPILQYEWDESDPFEPTFHESKPIAEWVSDSILRLGENRSDQPFMDEVRITNKTNEPVKYLSVGYGKNELFWLFDVPPEQSILLKASPRFKPDGTSNYFLGYGGMTLSGKKFEGVMEKQRRQSSTEGALRFEVTITAKDLK